MYAACLAETQATYFEETAMSQPEFSEEELRQLEAEMERITVDDVLIQTTVTLLNIAARKAGLGAPDPGQAAPAPDWEQVRQAIEGARALLPLLESRHAEQLGPVRDTLSRLQMVYAKEAGGKPAAPPERGRGIARAARRIRRVRGRRRARAACGFPGNESDASASFVRSDRSASTPDKLRDRSGGGHYPAAAFVLS